MKKKDLLKLISNPPPRKEIEVIEWKAKFYASPLTPQDELDMATILDGIEMLPAQRMTYEGAAQIIIKLQNEDGTPAFDRGNLNDLMQNVPSKIISKIMRKISLIPGHYAAEVGEAKKGLKPIQSE